MFAFHWDHGGNAWQHLRVVSFRAIDALSSPYRVELVLHARGSEAVVDPEELVSCLADGGFARNSRGGSPSTSGTATTWSTSACTTQRERSSHW